jgi:hypothetical protein
MKKRKMGTKNMLRAVAVSRALRKGVPVSRIAATYKVSRQAVNQFIRRNKLR